MFQHLLEQRISVCGITRADHFDGFFAVALIVGFPAAVLDFITTSLQRRPKSLYNNAPVEFASHGSAAVLSDCQSPFQAVLFACEHQLWILLIRSRARLVSPGSQSTGNATVCFSLVPTGRHTSSIRPRLFRTVQPGLPARTAARNPLSQAAPPLVFAMGHFLLLMTAMLSSRVL